MKAVKMFLLAGVIVSAFTAVSCVTNKGISTMNDEKLTLTQKWDKVFPQNPNVTHKKVTFHNRYGITLAADMYMPKNASGKLAAIAVSGPFGAVKEQASGLYAQEMASRGFLTIAFDPSFTGESGGYPRDTNSADINTEDFSAAVDFLSTQNNVDPERIGIIGICGWGGFALNAAAIDTRIKATLTSTMYDMSRVIPFGYNDSVDENARYETKKALAAQRTADYASGEYAKPAVSADLPDDAPQFLKDYAAYYGPKGRAWHVRSINYQRGWLATSAWSLMNMPLLQYSKEIRSPVLMIHGENAHSLYFSKDAYKNMTSGSGAQWAANKELYIVPGANHTDLYDGGLAHDKIPWAKIEEFFAKNLK